MGKSREGSYCLAEAALRAARIAKDEKPPLRLSWIRKLGGIERQQDGAGPLALPKSIEKNSRESLHAPGVVAGLARGPGGMRHRRSNGGTFLACDSLDAEMPVVDVRSRPPLPYLLEHRDTRTSASSALVDAGGAAAAYASSHGRSRLH